MGSPPCGPRAGSPRARLPRPPLSPRPARGESYLPGPPTPSPANGERILGSLPTTLVCHGPVCRTCFADVRALCLGPAARALPLPVVLYNRTPLAEHLSVRIGARTRFAGRHSKVSVCVCVCVRLALPPPLPPLLGSPSCGAPPLLPILRGLLPEPARPIPPLAPLPSGMPPLDPDLDVECDEDDLLARGCPEGRADGLIPITLVSLSGAIRRFFKDLRRAQIIRRILQIIRRIPK